jgi:cell division protein FtsB
MKLDSITIKASLSRAARAARKYILPMFLVFLLSIYGFLAWRIVVLNQVQPDQSAVATKLKTAGVPRIDQDALDKIQKLQDNSVGVQTLFDKARNSPFQE